MKTSKASQARHSPPQRSPGSNKPADTSQVVTSGEKPISPLNQRVKPQWAWHYRVLLELRERLVAAEVGQLAKAAEPLEFHNRSPADSGTDEFDHDVALSTLSAEADALHEVEEAIRRILDGNYGICQETGQPIGEQRLRAIPWTRFSRDAAARLESGGALRRPHLHQAQSIRGAT
jgi:RNA polymerase-binding transcription factor DksA